MKMKKRIELFIERILWESRLIIFFAVVAAVSSSILLILTGSIEVLQVFKKVAFIFGSKEEVEYFYKFAIKHIITAVDIYLIATVLLIFGVGLYELFISKIDYIEEEKKSSKILQIHTLDQLKEKLAKVILMVLIVTFFKYALDYHYETIESLFLLSIAIFLVSLAIYMMHKGHAESSEETKKEKNEFIK